MDCRATDNLPDEYIPPQLSEQSETKSSKFPGRPAENKVDVSQALKLYLDKGLTKSEIAQFFNVAPQTITYHLQPFDNLLKNGGNLQAYRDNRVSLKDNLEFILLSDLADEEKRKAASLNNTAYAYRQIHETRRLDDNLSTVNLDLHAEFEAMKTLKSAINQLSSVVCSPTENDNNE